MDPTSVESIAWYAILQDMVLFADVKAARPGLAVELKPNDF